MLGRAFMFAAAVGTAAAQVAPPRAVPLFQFTADDFWLNLHHYLYVLGRAHNGADSGQPAVASAPDDERQGRAALSDADRASWDDAVSAYESGLSRRSSVLQPPLAPMTVALATGGDTDTFPVATFDASTRSILERAAPIYRKGWWCASATIQSLATPPHTVRWRAHRELRRAVAQRCRAAGRET